MKKTNEIEKPLDFSKAVRGKYYARMQQGANVVVIAPDLLKVFPDSESVNDALRAFRTMTERSAKISKTSRKRSAARKSSSVNQTQHA
ncbi:MAG TPA: hypothetical protein VGG18_04060 [Granulicella sp.]|jgi:hypothetical protein